jgi:hypothetical protein
MCLLLLLLLGGPLPLAAQSAADLQAAREAFQLGNAAFGEQEYRSAIHHFRRANSLVPNARLLEYIARSHAALGEFQEALAAIDEYGSASEAAADEVDALRETFRVAMHEAVQLAAWGRVGAALSRARGEAPPPRDAMRMQFDSLIRDVRVQIRSTPRGAEVFVDRVDLGPVGQTPLETNLFAGQTYIEVRHPHYQPQGRVVTIAPVGRNESIPVFEFALVPRDVPVEIRVQPVTAQATWVGPGGQTRTLGQGGWTGALPAGPAVFLLQQGGQDRRVEVDIGAEGDGPQVIALNMVDEVRSTTLAIGTLVIQSDALVGEVYVDGRRVGAAPGQLPIDLTPGMHTVDLRRERYCTWSQQVEILPGETTRVYTPRELTRGRCR